MKTRFRTFRDVEEYLNTIPRFSDIGTGAAHFGLDHMERFCSLTGDPQNAVEMIHVAGTNGKGTTCQMLASIFQEAGYKTGLYTSPHLIEYNERIRIDSRNISNVEILDFFIQNEDVLNQVTLTYFEISTCMAFWYFSRSACDIAIIETGLGGRLDATNIIRPLASVITSISADHMDILGETIEEIAGEKAGIIKSGKPVIVGNLEGKALDVIRKKANECHSELYLSADYHPAWHSGSVELSDPENGQKIEVSGCGRKHVDRFNMAATLAVIRAVEDQFPRLQDCFKAGLEKVDQRFPEHAHFQKLHSSRNWYFDGSHNCEAVTSLIDQISLIRGTNEPVFFLSLMKDKISRELLENFRPYKYVYYIERGIERNASCDQVRSVLPQVQCLDSKNPEVARILNRLKSELVIFAGSFYFYQQVKYWMASQPPSDHMKNSGLRP